VGRFSATIAHCLFFETDLDLLSCCRCEANPGYMLVSCKQSCALYTAPAPYEPVASHFNEVEALDINGARVSFGEAFAGRVVLVTNVASYCGRTDSHYRELAVF